VNFLTEFQDSILFGTDVCFGGTEGRMPHLGYLRTLRAENQITPEVFAKIVGANALKILTLHTSDSKVTRE